MAALLETLSAKTVPRTIGRDPQVHEHEDPFRDFAAVTVNRENPVLSLIWSCTDPNPERVAVATGNEVSAVRRECKGQNTLEVTPQREHRLTCPHVPQPHRLVPAAGCQTCSIRAEDNVGDIASMTNQSVSQIAG